MGSSLTLSPFAHGLAGYWGFDDGSGTIAGDSSGNNLNVTLFNTPTWQTSANCKIGSCLLLNGTTNYGAYSGATPFSTQVGTITAWAYPQGTTSSAFIFAMYTGTDRHYISWSTSFNIARGNPSTNISLGSSLPLNNWYFLVMTWDNSTMKGYLDGAYINQAAYTNTAIPQTYFSIGSQAAASYFNGKIDDVSVYNRVLSVAEIQVLYNAEK